MELLLRSFLNHSIYAFIVAAILAPIIIYILYKGRLIAHHILMRNRMNEEFLKFHKHKSGTPTIGGLIITIPFIVLMLVIVPQSAFRDVFLWGYGLFALYGLIEELIVRSNTQNKTFRLFQESFVWRTGKFLLMYGIGIFIASLITNVLGIDSMTIWEGFVVPFDGIWWLLWAGIMVAAVFGAEITDGLDGLVTGLFLVAYLTYLAIASLLGFADAAPIIGLLVGAMLVYLYFNITPARVFMGGVAAMPLGFGLALLAIVTDTIIPFFLITAVFWVELASSFIQIFSIKFLNKKIFRIAPIHHHFEAIGWSEPKVVQRFWLAGAVLALAGVWVYLTFLK
jgi:phospho-N-acetylmuramoyl-pentapeptide-transferase